MNKGWIHKRKLKDIIASSILKLSCPSLSLLLLDNINPLLCPLAGVKFQISNLTLFSRRFAIQLSPRSQNCHAATVAL